MRYISYYPTPYASYKNITANVVTVADKGPGQITAAGFSIADMQVDANIDLQQSMQVNTPQLIVGSGTGGTMTVRNTTGTGVLRLNQTVGSAAGVGGPLAGVLHLIDGLVMTDASGNKQLFPTPNAAKGSFFTPSDLTQPGLIWKPIKYFVNLTDTTSQPMQATFLAINDGGVAGTCPLDQPVSSFGHCCPDKTFWDNTTCAACNGAVATATDYTARKGRNWDAATQTCQCGSEAIPVANGMFCCHASTPLYIPGLDYVKGHCCPTNLPVWTGGTCNACNGAVANATDNIARIGRFWNADTQTCDCGPEAVSVYYGRYCCNTATPAYTPGANDAKGNCCPADKPVWSGTACQVCPTGQFPAVNATDVSQCCPSNGMNWDPSTSTCMASPLYNEAVNILKLLKAAQDTYYCSHGGFATTFAQLQADSGFTVPGGTPGPALGNSGDTMATPNWSYTILTTPFAYEARRAADLNMALVFYNSMLAQIYPSQTAIVNSYVCYDGDGTHAQICQSLGGVVAYTGYYKIGDGPVPACGTCTFRSCVTGQHWDSTVCDCVNDVISNPGY
ncbi:MAG: hypothetical protein FWF35_05750 [Elusimicrobia bacterium]|nr:hypothetical protein [Elusimicrobiota bacterium]